MVDRDTRRGRAAAGNGEAGRSRDAAVAPRIVDFRAQEEAMKLYHFPSPNPQKVTFALHELGLECEIVPVDLSKGEQRTPQFLALNPFGRVPVLVDGDVTLWESHAILAYLGEKTGKLWPTTAAGRADALRWLFFLAGHISPAA